MLNMLFQASGVSQVKPFEGEVLSEVCGFNFYSLQILFSLSCMTIQKDVFVLVYLPKTKQ